jgi:hypothetical protein
MRACYRHFDTCMLHLFCKINPPTYISTRDHPRYWTRGRCFPERGAPGGWINILKSYWTRGRCFPERGAPGGWIDILKSYWTRGRCFPERGAPGGWINILKATGPGQVSPRKGGAREEKGRAQRQDRGRCFPERGASGSGPRRD